MEVCEVMQRVRGKGAAPDDGVVGGGQEGSGRERARPQRLARVTEGWDRARTDWTDPRTRNVRTIR